MTKRKVKYVPVPRAAFKLDDEILAKSIHRLHPIDQHVIVTAECEDQGSLIARVAKLLKHGFNVYVKTDSSLWLNHFDFVGEGRYEYKVYTRRPISSDSDVQQVG